MATPNTALTNPELDPSHELPEGQHFEELEGGQQLKALPEVGLTDEEKAFLKKGGGDVIDLQERARKRTQETVERSDDTFSPHKKILSLQSEIEKLEGRIKVLMPYAKQEKDKAEKEEMQKKVESLQEDINNLKSELKTLEQGNRDEYVVLSDAEHPKLLRGAMQESDMWNLHYAVKQDKVGYPEVYFLVEYNLGQKDYGIKEFKVTPTGAALRSVENLKYFFTTEFVNENSVNGEELRNAFQSHDYNRLEEIAEETIKALR